MTASGRLLESRGIRNYVIDPASLQVDRRARRVKTDGVDVERLLRSLMAYLRGEPKVWSVVRVPSVSEEDDRRLHPERRRLIGERIQHVNRIKGLLAIHGIYDYEPMHRDRMQRLERLQTIDGQELPPRLKAEIVRELQRLELVVRMVKTIEAERDAIASAKTTKWEHSNAKKIQDLGQDQVHRARICERPVCEVFYRPFDNRQQLASYVGLTPSHFQSGPMSRDQGISKAGLALAMLRVETASNVDSSRSSYLGSWASWDRSLRNTICPRKRCYTLKCAGFQTVMIC
jgi:transposase